MATTLPDIPDTIGESWTNPETGVTYEWDGERWIVKGSYNANDYVQRAGDTMFGPLLLPFPPTDLQMASNKFYVDNQDNSLQDQITELETQRGAGLSYRCSGTSVSNARSGEMYFSSRISEDVTQMSIGVEDQNGQLTKSIQVGDILEVDSADGVDTRYRVVTNAAAPIRIDVEHISGDQIFQEGLIYTVYIYPQNASGVSKEYVDQQDEKKLDLTGGTLTGSTTFKEQVILDLPVVNQFGKEGFLIKGTNWEGEQSNILRVFHNSNDNPDAVNYHGQIVNPDNLVNKQYVDYLVAHGGNDAFSRQRKYPPGIQFQYVTDQARASKFTYKVDGDEWYIIMSKISQAEYWRNQGPKGTVNYGPNTPFMIYAEGTNNVNTDDNGVWDQIVIGTFYKIDWNTNDIKIYINQQISEQPLVVNDIYWITMSGIF